MYVDRSLTTCRHSVGGRSSDQYMRTADCLSVMVRLILYWAYVRLSTWVRHRRLIKAQLENDPTTKIQRTGNGTMYAWSYISDAAAFARFTAMEMCACSRKSKVEYFDLCVLTSRSCLLKPPQLHDTPYSRSAQCLIRMEFGLLVEVSECCTTVYALWPNPRSRWLRVRNFSIF